jgi:uncharacterized surface protein with fasciclin (FAS1) repeats
MRKLILALAGTAMMATSVQAANVVETAAEAGVFNTLLAAAAEASLAGALAETDNITVFAPTDEAFAALPAGTVESLLLEENRDQLVAILTYHVLPRELRSTDLPGRTISVRTLNTGDNLGVTKSHGSVTVDGANVVTADIQASNGVIHVIDAVLIPDGRAH